MAKTPNWMDLKVMVLRSEFKNRFKRDEAAFLVVHPNVRRMKFKPRNYILTGRVFK